MNNQIWKYPLPIADKTYLSVPLDSSFLAVKEQAGELCVWVIVNTEELDTIDVPFIIRGTGHDFTGEEGGYIDSVVMSNGLVWHLFADE